MTVHANSKIRTRPCPYCYTCGTKGKLLYKGLQDRLFSAPGEWNLRKCPNSECGLVWLDPMPIEEDIGKAYQTYYTHQDSSSDREDWGIRRFLRYGLKKTWDLFLRVTPIYWERKRLYLMYLVKNKPGRLLEVGCGNGHRLAQFRAMEWQVEGQEVDLKAANLARKLYNLKIHLGPVEELRIPDATFDAIIMHHVIEHLHHPEILLAECHRLLRTGGKLVVVTPNIESFGHRRFGADWRGLEPPRHIHIFSCKTLLKLASKAEFNQCALWTTAANTQGIAAISLDIQRASRHLVDDGLKPRIHIAAILFQLWATVFYVTRKDSGEECVMKAEK